MEKKLFIPRKLSGEGSRWEQWNNSQKVINGVQINQYDIEGIKQGYWEYYFDDDVIQSRGSYKNGKEEGIWEWYYYFDDVEFNFLHIRSTYKGGKLNGLRELFHITGELSSKKYFINGKEEGVLDFIIRKINNWRYGK